MANIVLIRDQGNTRMDAYTRFVRSSGPVVYWPMYEKTGSVSRELMNRANGVYSGVTLGQENLPFVCPYWAGSAGRNNIKTDALNSLWSKGEGSFMIWSKVNSAAVWTDGVQRTLFNMSTTGANDYLWLYKTSGNNAFSMTYRTGATNRNVLKEGYSPTGWVQYVITWSRSGNAVLFYINSSLDTSLTASGNPTAELILAADVGRAASTYWHGWIAHASLYNRVLPAPEITNLYNMGTL